MKRLFISVTAISLFTLFFVSCYYDNEEALYPALNIACDSTNVTFSGTIVPLLSNNCYTCHSDENAALYGNDIHLQDHADVTVMAVAMQAAIKFTGEIKMPKNGSKLKECSIAQFDIWVRNGMLNN